MIGRGHVDARVTDLVDGRLDPDSAGLLFAHAATCPACKAAIDAERAVKGDLADSRDPRPSPALRARLVALGAPGDPVSPRRPTMPSPARPSLPPVPGPRSTVHSRRLTAPSNRDSAHDVHRGGSSSGGHRRRKTLVGIGALSFAGAALAVSFAAGAAPEPGAPVTPSTERFAIEHAATTTGLTFAETGLDVMSGFMPVTSAPGFGDPGRRVVVEPAQRLQPSGTASP